MTSFPVDAASGSERWRVPFGKELTEVCGCWPWPLRDLIFLRSGRRRGVGGGRCATSFPVDAASGSERWRVPFGKELTEVCGCWPWPLRDLIFLRSGRRRGAGGGRCATSFPVDAASGSERWRVLSGKELTEVCGLLALAAARPYFPEEREEKRSGRRSLRDEFSG
ncbi:outer membrane protein assembly factor BamB family protein [Neolewinella agarilytica]|uniref:outer membrane protein assembly factor BamB family protein n=1 Tax=Neolewinella agarilytica TaxID=478744 RepID=UPI0038730D1F